MFGGNATKLMKLFTEICSDREIILKQSLWKYEENGSGPKMTKPYLVFFGKSLMLWQAVSVKVEKGGFIYRDFTSEKDGRPRFQQKLSNAFSF